MTDEQAWALGVEMARSDPDSRFREQIERMLAEDGPKEAGKQACYHFQFATLKARPWATVPCSLLEHPEAVLARGATTPESALDYEGAVLAKRLLDAGISLWAPDPEQALREAAKKKGVAA
jgi:hypothetical protein